MDDVEACVARNLPESTGALDFDVRVVDREGGRSDSAARFLWRRDGGGLSRAVLRLTEPARTAGTSVLLVERSEDDPELFVYLPGTQKVKRVRKSRLRGSLFGTDFSYEDFERLQGLAAVPEISVRDDFELEGRPVWVLDARPESRRESDYSRVVSYVDREFCLPLRMEFVDWKPALRKVLTVAPEAVRREGGRHLPETLVMRDLRDGTETLVTVRSVSIDPDLSEELFTKQALSDPAP